MNFRALAYARHVNRIWPAPGNAPKKDDPIVAILTTSRIRVVSDSDLGEVQYTDLFASIAEEDGGYTVQVRLSDKARPQSAAWGEEIADSIEAASMLVDAIATEFSIPQAHIKIEIRMHNM